MTEGNGLRFQMADHERRLSKIEEANIWVLAEKVATLASLVRVLIYTIATFILTIISGIVIFIVTQGPAV